MALCAIPLLWPPRTAAGVAAGALFALYPGFTWWVQGIEYQPMVSSAALMVISFALTLQALRPQGAWSRAACIAGAILTGWSYLSLVEYAAGMELFRVCLIFLAVGGPDLHTLRERLREAFQRWLIYLIIPVGFLFWRFVFFTSERKATDLAAQLGGFLTDPLSTGLRWIMNLLLSLLNVTLAAWVQPLLGSFFAGTQQADSGLPWPVPGCSHGCCCAVKRPPARGRRSTAADWVVWLAGWGWRTAARGAASCRQPADHPAQLLTLRAARLARSCVPSCRCHLTDFQPGCRQLSSAG
jgi:hypothetical protein